MKPRGKHSPVNNGNICGSPRWGKGRLFAARPCRNCFGAGKKARKRHAAGVKNNAPVPGPGSERQRQSIVVRGSLAAKPGWEEDAAQHAKLIGPNSPHLLYNYPLGWALFLLGRLYFLLTSRDSCPRSETLRSGTNELTGLKTTERRGAELMTSSGFAKNSRYRGPCRVILLLGLLR